MNRCPRTSAVARNRSIGVLLVQADLVETARWLADVEVDHLVRLPSRAVGAVVRRGRAGGRSPGRSSLIWARSRTIDIARRNPWCSTFAFPDPRHRQVELELVWAEGPGDRPNA